MSEILPPKRSSAKTGLNIADLGDASAEEVSLVRLLLRNEGATTAELWARLQERPANKQMSREVFETTLQKLIDAKWVWKTGTGETATFSTRLQKRISRVRAVAQLNAQPSAAFNQMWDLLDQRAKIEQDAAAETRTTQPAAFTRLQNWAAGLGSERQVLLLLVFISAASSFSASTLEVTGVSGFVETVGAPNLPWLQIAEMLLGLATSAVYIQYADRFPRVHLMKWILGGLVVTYLLITGLFLLSPMFGGLTSILYPLVYLLRSQQIILFPIAFWNLANSLYSMVEARRVFPTLAAGGTIGGLLGYVMFAELFAGIALFDGGDAPLLLGLNAGLYLLALLFTQFILREPAIDETPPEPQGIFASIRAGLQNIHEVPLFRNLALVVMFVRITFCLFIYHNLVSLNEVGDSFSNLYSLFGIASALLPLILQWQVVPRFSNKVSTRTAFIVLPVTLALSISVISLLPGALPVAIGLLISGSVASSWDFPIFNTMQSLIPEERRAQVSTLLNNYSFAVGQISGSLLLLAVLVLAPLFNLPEKWIYLPAAFLAALGAIVAALMVRRTYTDSMLSWRIARRQRSSSVLDKLDF